MYQKQFVILRPPSLFTTPPTTTTTTGLLGEAILLYLLYIGLLVVASEVPLLLTHSLCRRTYTQTRV